MKMNNEEGEKRMEKLTYTSLSPFPSFLLLLLLLLLLYRAFNGAKEVTCTRNKDETGLHWHVNWNNSPKCECGGGGGDCGGGECGGCWMEK
ncbi:hypothetical protein E2C01_089448 [Portunus trituberculatus]|uniref:Uncharacterized protein n=1 Tax=Portunus trituberculatus TaxID=210409 RepID=A0A5B7JJ25_PORTR|nr:hypothetical protein [Portunus trituberculatus]